MFAIPSSSSAPPRPRGVDLKDEILENLSYEVRSRFSGTELSPELQLALEELPPGERRDLVNTKDENECAPLFHTCRMGNVTIAKYLVETCRADMEQCGKMDMFSEERPHVAPPLWAASVYGGVPIAEYLLSQGANVNATSNSRSTPVRSACFMSNIEIVNLLVGAGADIFITNECGGSCLTNSVQSPELCRLLLDRGVDVNQQDIEGNTALHYAIRERRLETTEILMEHGADIFRRNKWGQSPLELAAVKGMTQIYEAMTRIVPISPQQESDMLDLMGFFLVPEKHGKAMEQFVKAADLRERHGLQKPILGYWPRYASVVSPSTGEIIRRIQEYSTRPGWESIAENHVMLELQALLVAERLLGNFHKEFLKRLGKFGYMYSSNNLNFYAIHASQAYAFQMQFLNKGNGILFTKTTAALESLMSVYMRWRNRELEDSARGFDSTPIPFELLMETLNFLIEQLPEVSRQIVLRPHLPRQRTAYDTYFLACSNLVNLLLSSPRKREELGQIAMASELLGIYARPIHSTGDTLLHLAVRRLGYSGVETVPNLEHVRLLLHVGADVNAINQFKESPLHIFLKHEKYEEWQWSQIADLLVSAGAHLDQLDSTNFSPLETLLEKPYPGFTTSPPITLQCITAKVLGTLGIPYDASGLPEELVDFVRNHARVDTSTPPKVDLYPTRHHYYY